MNDVSPTAASPPDPPPTSPSTTETPDPQPPPNPGGLRRWYGGLDHANQIALITAVIGLVGAVVAAAIGGGFQLLAGNQDQQNLPQPTSPATLTVPETTLPRPASPSLSAILTMPATTSPSPSPSATQVPVKDLYYQVTAVHVDVRIVKVTITATGQPRPGLSYWFMLKVDYGGGSVQYYPRLTLTAQPSPFEVTIPPGADIQYARSGQVFALNAAQNTDAEQRLARQSTTKVDDYFDTAPGEAVSNAATLPF